MRLESRARKQVVAVAIVAVLGLSGIGLDVVLPRWHTPAASSPPPAIAAAAAYVLDADTGGILYTLRADDQRAMASCTKLMTALVAVQHAPLDQSVSIGPDAVALVRQGSSSMGLSVGQTLTLDELLYGLLLPSGNDAAVAIADSVGGTQDHFVAMMNQEAQTLGLTHTHYANPHGLDAPGHYTSAHDLAVLSVTAMRNPIIARVVSTLHYIVPRTVAHKAYDLWSQIFVLPGGRWPYPGGLGIKLGNTGEAGWCMAFAARRNGHLIVGVVLGEPTWQVRVRDVHALLDWGFAQDGVPPAG
jgi:D-alanyl-D-alanine carboxypeptidase (penicillin-binding protein 5/6)